MNVLRTENVKRVKARSNTKQDNKVGIKGNNGVDTERDDGVGTGGDDEADIRRNSGVDTRGNSNWTWENQMSNQVQEDKMTN